MADLSLEELLAEVSQPKDGRMNKEELAKWNAGVHQRLDNATPGLHSDPLEALFNEVLREPAVWIVDAAVVLIEETQCLTCLESEQSCKGWFGSYKHRTDKHARRLVAGRPAERLPIRVERVEHEPVMICSSCAESQIAIELAARPDKVLRQEFPAEWRRKGQEE